MEGGALFKVQWEAKERVLAAFTAIDIRKKEVGGYAYNDANALITEIECVLAGQLFERFHGRIEGPPQHSHKHTDRVQSHHQHQTHGRPQGLEGRCGSSILQQWYDGPTRNCYK